jgi:glucan phosphoethanolaminetransferase (alkaline phosphatase superfamily)
MAYWRHGLLKNLNQKNEVIIVILMKSRKGNVIDLLFIMVLIFVAVFGMVMNAFTANLINQTVSTMGAGVNTTHTERAASTVFNMDIVVAGMFFGLMLASVISAYYVGSHPFFFIFSVIFLMILLVVSPILSNTIDDIMDSSSDLNTIAERMPYTMWVGRYLPYELFLGFILICLSLYAGKNSGGEF